MDDIKRKKQIKPTKYSAPQHGESESPSPSSAVPVRDFSVNLNSELQSLGISEDVLSVIVEQAKGLLKTAGAITEKPRLENVACIQNKFLVASRSSKIGFYECTVFKEHVSCQCQQFKCIGLCKHSLCVAEVNSMLPMHVRATLRRKHKFKSMLDHAPKDTAGKKGGKHKNNWRPPRQGDENIPVPVTNPFTQVHHNNHKLEVCFLIEQPKAKDCRIEFPSTDLVGPSFIILSHRERWQYTDRSNPLIKRKSAQETTKFYCIRASCVLHRFTYFTPKSYLSIAPSVQIRLQGAHLSLLKEELNYECE
jgi:hypothetical protein